MNDFFLVEIVPCRYRPNLCVMQRDKREPVRMETQMAKELHHKVTLLKIKRQISTVSSYSHFGSACAAVESLDDD